MHNLLQLIQPRPPCNRAAAQYETKEDPARPGVREYVTVQCIEPQFYKLCVQGMGLDPATLPKQMDQVG